MVRDQEASPPLGCSSELTILQASKMDRAGIKVVAINSATRDAASRLREEELCTVDQPAAQNIGDIMILVLST